VTGEKNTGKKEISYITLTRAAEKPPQDYQQGRRSKAAATRIEAPEGGLADGGHPNYLSPQTDVHNTEFHLIAMMMAGR
jgi:hypothetical protein